MSKRELRKPAAATTSTAAHRAPVWPTPAELLDWRGPYLIPLALLVISRLIAFFSLPLAAEDAYITFRYARHFAGGLGLVYNPGEHAMGYTSPLWVMVCAAGFKLAQDPVIWTRALLLLADAVTLLVMAGLLQRHASSLAAWAFAVFFAAWPYYAATAASGMEPGVMMALIALSAALIARGSVFAGPALALLALTRPEGVAAAAVLALGASWRDRGVALLLAAAGWGAMAWVHGSPIPQSVVAKADLYGTPGPWLGRHWWEWLSPVQFGRWPATAEGNTLAVLTVVMLPAAILGARALWAEHGTALARAIAAALVVWLGYAALGVAFFSWYLLVPLTGIAALSAVGLPSVSRSRLLLATLALLVVGTWPTARILYLGRAQNEFAAFQGAAVELSRGLQPGQSVMLEPIGIIGYQCPLVVIDEVGLVSPDVAARRLKGPGWYSDIVAQRRPDWIVVRKSTREAAQAFAGRGAPYRNAAERDSVFARYELQNVVDPGRGDLEVFRRVR